MVVILVLLGNIDVAVDEKLSPLLNPLVEKMLEVVIGAAVVELLGTDMELVETLKNGEEGVT